MKLNALVIATLISGFAAQGNTVAQTHNIRVLEARVTSIESRVSALEQQMGVADGQAIPRPQPDLSYEIRDGDTLGGIARKFDVPRQALLDANNMSEGQPIYIGETLIVPTSRNAKDISYSGGSTVHIVKSGETLTRISARYGTTIAAIKQANGLKSDAIGAGQHLVIPTDRPQRGANSARNEGGGHKKSQSSASTAQSTAPGEKAAQKEGKYEYDNPLLDGNETYGYYAVQKGDNLYALARDFFTSMNELQRLNKLGNSTIIYPGDELIVPTSKYNEYHKNVAKN